MGSNLLSKKKRIVKKKPFIRTSFISDWIGDLPYCFLEIDESARSFKGTSSLPVDSVPAVSKTRKMSSDLSWQATLICYARRLKKWSRQRKRKDEASARSHARKLVFDCRLHGCSQSLMNPSKKQLSGSELEDGKPCSDQCYLWLRVDNKVLEGSVINASHIKGGTTIAEKYRTRVSTNC